MPEPRPDWPHLLLDHITLAGTTIGLQRQWGILFIAASLATVV
ncbi:MAG: hypothetical protein ACK59G_15320 [Cyanobacteriota bacterium]